METSYSRIGNGVSDARF